MIKKNRKIYIKFINMLSIKPHNKRGRLRKSSPNCNRLLSASNSYKYNTIFFNHLLCFIYTWYRLHVYFDWTDLFDLDRMNIPCDWTDNIPMNFMHIFVWIFILFAFIHDIYYISPNCNRLLSASNSYKYNTHLKCICVCETST
jgi:hypothetical protein